MTLTNNKFCHLLTLVGVAYLMIMSIYLSARADSNDISCNISTPKFAEIGKPVIISYEITGGSGNYTNISIGASGTIKVLKSGSSFGKADVRKVNSPSGTLEFIAPAGDELVISISGQDAITKEDFRFFSDFPLSSNSDFSIVLSPNKSEYFKGETITIDYSLSGFSEIPENAYLWWSIGFTNHSAELELAKKNILSLSGTASFSTLYGDCVVCYLSGTDNDGIPFLAKSCNISLKEISEIPISFLPSSLTRIESKAFANTQMLAIYIPESIKFIADDAFENSSILVIYGNSDYIKSFANNHNILVVKK